MNKVSLNERMFENIDGRMDGIGWDGMDGCIGCELNLCSIFLFHLYGGELKLIQS